MIFICWHGVHRSIARRLFGGGAATCAEACSLLVEEPTEAEISDILGACGLPADKVHGPGTVLLLRLLVTSGKAVLVDLEELEYTVGDQELANPSVTLSPVLLDECASRIEMGITARFTCSGRFLVDPPCQPDARTLDALDVTMSLEAVCEETDALPACCRALQSGWTLRRRILRRGDARQCGLRNPGAAVTYRVVELRTPDGQVVEVHGDERRATLGNGDVCEALEFGLLHMQCGERARFFASWALLAAKPPAEAHGSHDMAGVAQLVVELVGTEGGLDAGDAPSDCVLAWAATQKNVGRRLLVMHRDILALAHYHRIDELVTRTIEAAGVHHLAEVDVQAAKDTSLTCKLNVARCCLSLKEWKAAASSCDEVLRSNANNSNFKAHYHRSRAMLGLRKYKEARASLQEMKKIEPDNPAIEKLSGEIEERRKATLEHEKLRIKKIMEVACEEEILSSGRDAQQKDWDYGGTNMVGVPNCITQMGGDGYMPSWDKIDPSMVRTLLECAEEQEVKETMEEYGVSEEEAIRVRRQGGL